MSNQTDSDMPTNWQSALEQIKELVSTSHSNLLVIVIDQSTVLANSFNRVRVNTITQGGKENENTVVIESDYERNA